MQLILRCRQSCESAHSNHGAKPHQNLSFRLKLMARAAEQLKVALLELLEVKTRPIEEVNTMVKTTITHKQVHL